MENIFLTWTKLSGTLIVSIFYIVFPLECFFLVLRSTSQFYYINLYIELCVLRTLCPQQLPLRGLFHIANSIAAAVLCTVQVWSSLPAQWKSSGSRRESTTREMPTGTSSPWCTQICRYSKEQLT